MSKSGEFLKNIPPQVYIYVIGIPVAVVVIYFGILNPLLKQLGIKDDKADKKASDKNFKESEKNYWTLEYWKNAKQRPSISESQADDIAEQIYDANSWYNDNEESVGNAFRKMNMNKSNVSLVADRFSHLYKEDLYGYLDNFLNPEEMDKYVYTPLNV